MVVIIAVGVVIWRDKKSEIKELTEVNEALVRQLEEMQSLVGEHSQGNEDVANHLAALSKQVHLEVDTMVNDAGAMWVEMETLADEQLVQIKTIQELAADEAALDIVQLQKHIKELEKSLSIAQKKASRQAKDLNKSRDTAKELKDKVKDLSRKVMELNSLSAKEQRLQREKERLKDRLTKMKEKYEHEKVVARNLRQELKTSFRADEVKGLRDELNNAEQELERSLAEKRFIETHFVSLDEVAREKDKIQEQLERAKREIETLERSIIEMDEAEQNLRGS